MSTPIVVTEIIPSIILSDKDNYSLFGFIRTHLYNEAQIQNDKFNFHWQQHSHKKRFSMFSTESQFLLLEQIISCFEYDCSIHLVVGGTLS